MRLLCSEVQPDYGESASLMSKLLSNIQEPTSEDVIGQRNNLYKVNEQYVISAARIKFNEGTRSIKFETGSHHVDRFYVEAARDPDGVLAPFGNEDKVISQDCKRRRLTLIYEHVSSEVMNETFGKKIVQQLKDMIAPQLAIFLTSAIQHPPTSLLSADRTEIEDHQCNFVSSCEIYLKFGREIPFCVFSACNYIVMIRYDGNNFIGLYYEPTNSIVVTDTGRKQRRQQKQEVLSSSWIIENNIPNDLLDRAKLRYTKGISTFLRLPAGSCQDHHADGPSSPDSICALFGLDYHSMPRVQYPQGSNSTCLACSLASVLHFLGYVDEAKCLMEWTNGNRHGQHQPIINGFGYIWRWIQQEATFKIFRKQWKMMKYKQSRIDILQYPVPAHTADTAAKVESLDEQFYWIILGMSNGEADHCITCTSQHVFNSNFDRALPLVQESLDMACAPSFFESIASGYCFTKRVGKEL